MVGTRVSRVVVEAGGPAAAAVLAAARPSVDAVDSRFLRAAGRAADNLLRLPAAVGAAASSSYFLPRQVFSDRVVKSRAIR